MKPLDLQVSIQNSYEAARSEAVRLEKPILIGQQANLDAKHEQALRDESVSALEAQYLQENLFLEDEYKSPDYENTGERKKEKHPQKKDTAKETVESTEEEISEDKNKNPQGNFTTYA
ncbi:MAG TPA: hypothetical protein PLY93_11265 [Turneriella sp.]|nr:hypothetical protein [Turneriella sp.]